MSDLDTAAIDRTLSTALISPHVRLALRVVTFCSVHPVLFFQLAKVSGGGLMKERQLSMVSQRRVFRRE